MSNKKHVALLVGGLSSEREVSLMTGEKIETSLIELGYDVTVIDVGRNIASKLLQTNPDIAFVGLHGKYGEDGCIQGLLEIMQIPYTHSGVTASAIAMNKHITKTLCNKLNITCAKGTNLTFEQIKNGKLNLEYPFVIKATEEGSSIGVYIVKEENDMPSLEELSKHKNYIIEEYISGRELSVATTDTDSLGVIELKPKQGFYDYKNKYTDNSTEYLMPANISESNYNKAMEWAYAIHKEIGCTGLTRSDFIIDGDDQLYFLEINTHPGLTKNSLAPKIAKYVDISYTELVKYMVENAKCQK